MDPPADEEAVLVVDDPNAAVVQGTFKVSFGMVKLFGGADIAPANNRFSAVEDEIDLDLDLGDLDLDLDFFLLLTFLSLAFCKATSSLDLSPLGLGSGAGLLSAITSKILQMAGISKLQT